jgi:hypothetical protein
MEGLLSHAMAVCDREPFKTMTNGGDEGDLEAGGVVVDGCPGRDCDALTQ